MMITDLKLNKSHLLACSHHDDYRLQVKQISLVRLLTQEVNCSHHDDYRLEDKQISLIRLLTQ
jgi:hypothetical protein